MLNPRLQPGENIHKKTVPRRGTTVLASKVHIAAVFVHELREKMADSNPFFRGSKMGLRLYCQLVLLAQSVDQKENFSESLAKVRQSSASTRH